MKNECAGLPPSEFVGLRSKMYSLLYDCKEKKTAKGISRSVVKTKSVMTTIKTLCLRKPKK